MTDDELVEIRGDPDDVSIEDIWIAGLPLGRLVKTNRGDLDELLEANSPDGGTDTQTQEARGRMCAIHRSLSDWKLHDADLKPTEQRAAWLFRQFLRSAVDDGPTAHVEGSNERLKMTSDGAKKTCAEYGHDLVSKQVGRAMTWLADNSTLPDDDAALFEVDEGKPRTVSVNGQRFGAYLRGVGAAADGDETMRTTADDAPVSAEDVDAELAELTAAQSKHTDTVVSKSNGRPSAQNEVVHES